MKTKLLFLFASFFYICSYSQVIFQEFYIEDGTQTALSSQDAISSDLDGDGDLDIISASENDDKIAWYENLDGQGNFGTQQVIYDEANQANSIYSADIDGDGDKDIVSGSFASFDTAKILWFENDGFGNFSPPNIILSNGDHIREVYVADIDGDADMDVVSAGFDALAWYENEDGQGNFGSRQIVEDMHARYVVVSDMDSDGDLDILSGFFWYENMNGAGDFADSPQIVSNESSIENIQAVCSVDLDNDNDMDVLIAGGNEIAWYENINGQGNFGVEQTITIQAWDVASVYSVDIDGDNDMDLLSASSDYYNNKLAWYENTDGQGNFDQEQIITTYARGANTIYADDIDGDMDMDVLFVSPNRIAWLENLDGEGNFGDQRIMLTGPSGPNFLRSGDLDSDGDQDVVFASTGDNKIGWYENTDGLGNFAEQRHITYKIGYPKCIHLADIDNDGDTDVLSASAVQYQSGKIAWYENIDGQGNFGSQQIITTNSMEASSVYTSDLDQDGDPDVLSSSQGDNKIAWYENLDGLGNFGNQQVISYDAEGAASVFATDIDNDGDIDVLSGSSGDNTVSWYENINGQSGFGATNIISESATNVAMVMADDLDMDGDMDVLSAGGYRIDWYKNMDTQGNFNYQTPISFSSHNAIFVHTADFDNDGDKDVLGVGDADLLRDNTNTLSAHKLVWYENTDGLGDFSDQIIITNQADELWSAYPADINGDGKIDIISAYNNKITWFENLGLASINENELEFFTVYPNPTSNILKIKSKTSIEEIVIRNTLGKKVLTNSNENQIDLSKLSSGIYFVEITGENSRSETKKIIKK